MSSTKAHYHDEIESIDNVDMELAKILRDKFDILEKDDNNDQIELENTIMRIYRISALSDPLLPPGVITDDALSIREALKIDEREDNNKFRDAIKAEIIDNLINKTHTLVPIDRDSIAQLVQHWRIHIVVKCKRKLKADGSYDKHKARGAARGDEYLRMLLKAGLKPPKSFIPTINH